MKYLISVLFLFLLSCSSSNKISKVECEQNSKINYVILPFKGDKFGVEDKIKEDLKSKCYNLISVYEVLRVIEKNNISLSSLSSISDYEVFKIGMESNADFIIWGDVYTNDKVYEKPEIKSTDNSFLKAFKESYAKSASGTWVYATLYKYDIKKGDKNILIKNDQLFKVQ